MATMRAMQVSRPGADFELVEREVPQPGPGEALVRVHGCGRPEPKSDAMLASAVAA